MGTLELLVKLASFGTAGVCLLAVFLVGKSILGLPKETPSWKVRLMRRYLNFCIIMAIISALSGAANAYFNQNKIRVAEQRFNVLRNNYEAERSRQMADNKEMENNLVSLRGLLQKQKVATPEANATLDKLDSKVMSLALKPVEELIRTPDIHKGPNR